MTGTEPHPPSSPIDILLSDPGKQEMVQRFFTELDRSYEALRTQDIMINTSENKPVGQYPATISRTGQLFELYTTERRVDAPMPETEITQATNYDVAHAALWHLRFGTELHGALIDLNRSDQTLIALQVVHLAPGNQLGRVMDVRRVAKYGHRKHDPNDYVMLFGRRDDSEIADFEAAMRVVERHTINKGSAELATSAEEAVAELAAAGAYVLPVKCLISAKENGDTSRGLQSLYTQGEPLSIARKRVGFAL